MSIVILMLGVGGGDLYPSSALWCCAILQLHSGELVIFCWRSQELSCANIFLLSDAGSRHGFKAKVANYGCDALADIATRCASDQYGSISHFAPEVLQNGQASQVRPCLACSLQFLAI